MIKIENIDELISKFLSGEASPDEAMLLEDWKNENPNNLNYYSSSEKVFEFTHQNKPGTEPDNKVAWQKIQIHIEPENNIKSLISKFSYARVAASIVLIIGLGAALAYLFNNNKAKQEIVYNTDNKLQQIKLSDGTDITISPNSCLVVDKEFGSKNRILHLKGSAYFSVIHKEELPFIVDVGNVFIKDIGTKFSIRLSLDTDTVYVKVDEGVVLFFDSLGASLEIKATGRALYIKSQKRLVNTTETKNENANLKFADTRLAEVILKLNALYKTNIVLENSNLKNCTITTQFNQESLETVLGIITETLGLSYEKTPSGYVIKGQLCESK